MVKRSNFNLKITLYSDWNQINDSTDILIINTYGEAVKLYEISKCVLLGKSLIKWSIEKAKKSKLFDEIVVSTDSNKIANISKKAGASIPFLRPKKLSNDYAVDQDVLHHYLDYAKKHNISIVIIGPENQESCFESQLEILTALAVMFRARREENRPRQGAHSAM